MLTPNAAPLLLAAAEGGGFLSVDATLLWATLVAFALFAWILGKFAWGPLLKIVDDREKTIREQVDSAQLAAAEAKDLLAQHQEMLRGRAASARRSSRRRSRRPSRSAPTSSRRPAPTPTRSWRARASRWGARRTRRIAELRAQVADIAVEAASRIVKSSLTEKPSGSSWTTTSGLPRAQKEGRA